MRHSPSNSSSNVAATRNNLFSHSLFIPHKPYITFCYMCSRYIYMLPSFLMSFSGLETLCNPLPSSSSSSCSNCCVCACYSLNIPHCLFELRIVYLCASMSSMTSPPHHSIYYFPLISPPPLRFTIYTVIRLIGFAFPTCATECCCYIRHTRVANRKGRWGGYWLEGYESVGERERHGNKFESRRA